MTHSNSFVISVLIVLMSCSNARGGDVDVGENYRQTGLFIVPVTIAGVSGTGLLDTGATHVAIHTNEDGDSFRGFPLRTSMIRTQNGSFKTSVVSAVPFSISVLPIIAVDATVSNLSALSDFTGTHLDSIVGSNYLADKIVSWNAPNCEIELAGGQYHGIGRSYSIDLQKGVPFVPCKMPGLGLQNLRIDTGYNGALCLRTDTIGLLQRMGHVIVASETTSVDLSGRQSIQKTYFLRSLQFCDVTILNVPLTAGEYPGIGMQVLRQFQVAINFKDKLLWCQSRQGSDLPHHIFPNASGVDLRFVSNDRIVVANVRSGYNAANSGIHENDELVTLNGKPPSALSIVQIEETMGQSGSELDLRLRRSGREFGVKLKLKHPYKYPPEWPPEREEFNPDAVPEK